MRRTPEVLLASFLLGLALVQAGCRSDTRPWVPPQEYNATVVSDTAFVRTGRGDYVDGYLAEYELEFQKQRMFIALKLPRYLKGDRLIVAGRFTGDNVLMPIGGPDPEKVPVFEVEKAEPNIPKAPDIPTIK